MPWLYRNMFMTTTLTGLKILLDRNEFFDNLLKFEYMRFVI